MLDETLSLVALPLLSCAGVNFARARMIRQVALSSAVDPLDPVTVQFETRPSGPTSSRKLVLPSWFAASAEGG